MTCLKTFILRHIRVNGFTLFELVVVIALVGVLASVLLNRILFYQELAEKTAMEQTVGAIQSAVHMKMASLIAKNQTANLPELIKRNPITFLAEPPSNYLGEFYDLPPEDVVSGHWYFDSRKRNLIYFVKSSAHFNKGRSGLKQVEFQLQLITSSQSDRLGKADISGSFDIEGLSFREVVSYTWF